MLLILFKLAGLFTAAALGIFIFSLIRMRKEKTPTYKMLAAATGIYLAVLTAFFGWRITDVTMTPKAIPNADGTLLFEGHRYATDNFDEFPYGNGLKQVALVRYSADPKIEDYISDIFFPSRLYLEGNDAEKKVLWERGLMLEVKYKRVD